MDRDFLVSWGLLGALSSSLGAHNLSAGPMDRDFVALWELLGTHNRSARPMDRDFLASCSLLGALSTSDRPQEPAKSPVRLQDLATNQ